MKFNQTLLILTTLALLATFAAAAPAGETTENAVETAPTETAPIDTPAVPATPIDTPATPVAPPRPTAPAPATPSAKACNPKATKSDCAAGEVCSQSNAAWHIFTPTYACMKLAKEGERCASAGTPASCETGLVCKGLVSNWINAKCIKAPPAKTEQPKKTEEAKKV